MGGLWCQCDVFMQKRAVARHGYQMPQWEQLAQTRKKHFREHPLSFTSEKIRRRHRHGLFCIF